MAGKAAGLKRKMEALYLEAIAEAADYAREYAEAARESAEREGFSKLKLKLYLGMTARAVKEALELFAQMEKEI